MRMRCKSLILAGSPEASFSRHQVHREVLAVRPRLRPFAHGKAQFLSGQSHITRYKCDLFLSKVRQFAPQADRLAVLFDPTADRIEDRLSDPMFMSAVARNILRSTHRLMYGVRRDCVATVANGSAATASDGWRSYHASLSRRCGRETPTRDIPRLRRCLAPDRHPPAPWQSVSNLLPSP